MLTEEPADPQTEAIQMVEGIISAAKRCLKPQRRAVHLKGPALSAQTLALLEARKQAHQRWLRSRCPQAKKRRNDISREADKAVESDIRRHLEMQVKEAQAALDRGDRAAWAKSAKKLGGKAKSGGAPTALKDTGGVLRTAEGVVEVATDHFKALLGGTVHTTPAAESMIEAAVAERQLELNAAAVTGFLAAVGQPSPATDPGPSPCDPEPPPTTLSGLASSAGDAPTLAEVERFIKAVRTAAAPGCDQLDKRLLNSPTSRLWLHRVILRVWETGDVPVAWRQAIIVMLYKGKGPKDEAGNYRGISLLSLPGKVFAAIILHRVYLQIDAGEVAPLHEAQCGFRRGRGAVDAMFTLRALGSACKAYGTCFARAYVDFTKAYDSIDREALWRILELYGVHPKLLQLLQALHDESTAMVRINGKLGPPFKVTAGVRQGCVIAPTLFNIFLDFIVKQALARMPQGCGVRLHARTEYGVGASMSVAGRLGAESGRASVEQFVVLLYADDLVLMSHDPGELALMLKALDEVSASFGLRINAAKTEIQIEAKGRAADAEVQQVQLSGGLVGGSGGSFKYLGSWDDVAGLEKEIRTRRGRALGAFQDFAGIWDNGKMRVVDKMAVYKTFVLPHLLYGCETWNYTQNQMHALETTHNDCLRTILRMRRSDRHSLQHIHKVCSSEPLQLTIARQSLRWAGHVLRMESSRFPRQVFDCAPVGGHRGPGRPSQTFQKTLGHVITKVGVRVTPDVPPPALVPMGGEKEGFQWLLTDGFALAQDRVAWRSMLNSLTLEVAMVQPAPPVRRSARVQALAAGAV